MGGGWGSPCSKCPPPTRTTTHSASLKVGLWVPRTRSTVLPVYRQSSTQSGPHTVLRQAAGHAVQVS